MEKGYPKTASPTPTRAATDNTLLSGMGGGQWSHRRAGGGQGRRTPDKGPHSPRLPPPLLPSAPHKVVVFVPAPGPGGPRHLPPGSSSAPPPPTLLCVGSTSLSLLFSRLLKATSDKLLLQAVALKRLHRGPGTGFSQIRPSGGGRRRGTPAPHYPRATLRGPNSRSARSRPSPAAVPAPQLGPGLPYLRLHPTAQKARAQHANLGSSFACHFLPKIPLNSRFP